jgi:F-type H+-transporting ATPase subunit delta
MQGKISRRKLALYVADAVEAKRKLGTVLSEVAAYLVDSKRTREAELLVRAIEDELAVRGIVIAHVVTARPIAKELEKAIETLIGAREIHLDADVDPSVIGGVRVETPGKLLDATIKRKLLALHQAKI